MALLIRVSILVGFESKIYAERTSNEPKGLQFSWLQPKPLVNTEYCMDSYDCNRKTPSDFSGKLQRFWWRSHHFLRLDSSASWLKPYGMTKLQQPIFELHLPFAWSGAGSIKNISLAKSFYLLRIRITGLILS